MLINELTQGSDEWHEFRLNHFGASEAAAMLGISNKVKRTELMHMKHTGNAKVFCDWVQENILDYGHEVEALARPIIERIYGDELYPVTCSEGVMSASCDGLDMSETWGWEHKQWNAALAAAVEAKQLPGEFMAQPQQCMMITGAKKWVFTVSDGTEKNMVSMEVLPDPVWFERIRAGWLQFDEDLAAYVPAEVVAQAVGHTPETLPALRIEVTGMVTASNLAQYKEHALAVFEGINRDLKTDQDFANADKIVKWCGDVEDRLAAAKQHALSQTESIDALFRTIDDISAEARRTRLELDKLAKARKEQVRTEIQQAGVAAYDAHIRALNERIGKPYMSTVTRSIPDADFVGAMKGKRTVSSMQDAVNTTLANAKISASAIADRIQTNMNTLRELATGHAFLFADTAQIVLKENDDLTMLVKSRISEHQAAEAKKEADQRERIRKEEQEKAEKTVNEAKEAEDALVLSFECAARRIEQDSVPYIEKASRAYESTAKDWESDSRPRVAAAYAAGRTYIKERLDAAKARDVAAFDKAAEAAALVTHEAVVEIMMPTTVIEAMNPAPVTAAQYAAQTVLDSKPLLTDAQLQKFEACQGKPPELKLGQMAERLGFTLTAAFLLELGFEHSATDKAAKLYHESEWPLICAALIERIENACELVAA